MWGAVQQLGNLRRSEVFKVFDLLCLLNVFVGILLFKSLNFLFVLLGFVSQIRATVAAILRSGFACDKLIFAPTASLFYFNVTAHIFMFVLR